MTRALGIDIGTVSLKVAEIETSNKGQEIVGLYEVLRSPEQSEVDLLQSFLKTTHVPTSRIAIGVGPCNSLVRKVQLPFKDARVRRAVLSELEVQLPFSLDQFVVDIRLIRKVGRVFEFVVGVCPIDQVEKINAICQGAGIQPTALLDDTQALAELALAQKLPAADSDEPYAICDVGLSHSRIALVRGRNVSTLYKEKGLDPFPPEILELRKLERGSGEWVQYISDRRKVSLDEAKSWLIHRAEIQTSQNDLQSIKQDLSDDVKSALRPWVVELYQTFQASRVAHGVMPTTLYLTGGMIEIAGLREFLAHELRLKVSPWPIAVGFDTERYLPSESDNRGFASALALAVYFCKKDKTSWLNFKRSTNPNQKILTETWAKLLNPLHRRPLLVLSTFLVALWTYAFVSDHFLGKELSDSRTRLLAEIRKMDSRKANFARDTDALLSSSKTKKIVNDLIKERGSRQRSGPPPKGKATSEILLDLSALLPAKALLQSVNLQDRGSASSFRARFIKVTDQTEPVRVSKALTAKGYSAIKADVATSGMEVEASWTSAAPRSKKK